MSILTWIEDKKRLKVLNAPKHIALSADSSKGLWTRCDKCGVILYIKHLKENQRVCFGCSYHLQMMSQERIENLLDKLPATQLPESLPLQSRDLQRTGGYASKRSSSRETMPQNQDTDNVATKTGGSQLRRMVSTWRPLDETVSPCDPLKFHDQKNYTDRLQDAQERTGLQDAIQTGTGMIDGIPVALAVMDFSFMGGSMGSVVGEKITRLIEYATQEGLTLLIVSASGGARMQEGVFSLMQMAKISSALQIYQSCANLLYISILTSPTTGGVTASFAMLGDIIFAEPKALIAFAGRRVIEQTLAEDLPDDFQTSEYMLHHGLVDLIVPRRFLRQALSESIRLYQNAPFKKRGKLPFGVQNPINLLTEERIRRQWGTGFAGFAGVCTVGAQKPGPHLRCGLRTKKNPCKPSVCKSLAQNSALQGAFGFASESKTREQLHTYGDTAGVCKGAVALSFARAKPRDSWLCQQGSANKAAAPLMTKPLVTTPSFAGFSAKGASKGSSSFAPTVHRKSLSETEHGLYREILTSFEMMLNLFVSKSFLQRQNQGVVAPWFCKSKTNGNYPQNKGFSKARSAGTKLSFLHLRSIASPPLARSKNSSVWLRKVDLQMCTYDVTALLGGRAQGQAFWDRNGPILGVQRHKKESPLDLILKKNCNRSRHRGVENHNALAKQRSAGGRRLMQSGALQHQRFGLQGQATLSGSGSKNGPLSLNRDRYQRLVTDLYQNGLQDREELRNENGKISSSEVVRKEAWPNQKLAEPWRAKPLSSHAALCTKGAGGSWSLHQRCWGQLPTAGFCKGAVGSANKAPAPLESQQGFSKALQARVFSASFNRKQNKNILLCKKLLASMRLTAQLKEIEKRMGPDLKLSQTFALANQRFARGSCPLFCKSKTRGQALPTRLCQQKKGNKSLAPQKTNRYKALANQRHQERRNVEAENRERRDVSKNKAVQTRDLQHLSLPIWPRNEINRFALLHNFRCFSEVFASENTNRVTPTLSQEESPSKMTDFTAESADIAFLNQAIELAATESVEWRAFYIYQQLSENTGFLEDFLQQDQGLTEKEGNMLFYKSICRGFAYKQKA